MGAALKQPIGKSESLNLCRLGSKPRPRAALLRVRDRREVAQACVGFPPVQPSSDMLESLSLQLRQDYNR